MTERAGTKEDVVECAAEEECGVEEEAPAVEEECFLDVGCLEEEGRFILAVDSRAR